MNLTEVQKKLEESFQQKIPRGGNRSIIFWYDEEKEFVEDIPKLELQGGKVLILEDNNAFSIKYTLEKEDPTSNYLIYSPMAKPSNRDNWLMDILKYSSEFFTDKASLIMRELGVEEEQLTPVFKKHTTFFNNQERYRKFQSYSIAISDEEDLEIGILATLARADFPKLDEVIKVLLIEESQRSDKIMLDIQKFGDETALWNLIEKYYGYHRAEKNLESFVTMLLVTHFSYTTGEKIPETWEAYLSTKPNDVLVFVNQLMNDRSFKTSYDRLAIIVEETLNFKEYIDQWKIEELAKQDTFRGIDEGVIQWIARNLTENVGEYDRYRKAINQRRKTHWFSHFETTYETLYYALSFLEKLKSLDEAFVETTAEEMMENYEKSYYFVDQCYRKFYFYYDQLEDKELLSSLKEIIENTYNQGFLKKLSYLWPKLYEKDLLNGQELPVYNKQQHFYQKEVAPLVDSGDRVFVIISDALRFEAAKELEVKINKELRGTTKLKGLQGVIPSATNLGMASILPGKELSYKEDKGYMIDGIGTEGTENRTTILQKVDPESIAILGKDLLEMKRKEYQDQFRGKKLIYIYHNIIDAFGDHAATEREVFTGVEKAFDEIVLLVKNLVNHVSAISIMITADHGFIYRRSPLMEMDKIQKGKLDSGKILETKRRYILAKEDLHLEDTLSIPMDHLLQEPKGLQAIVPKGDFRFKVSGSGANFVHGGLSLQEIFIPMIQFKNIRKDEYKAKKVRVSLTNITRKVTNRIFNLDFFQEEPIDEKKLSVSLKLYFIDDQGERISNENIIIADSRSKKPEARTFKEKFTLKNKTYDKAKTYYLIMEDEEEKVEKIYEKITFSIDLLINDDFGF